MHHQQIPHCFLLLTASLPVGLRTPEFTCMLDHTSYTILMEHHFPGYPFCSKPTLLITLPIFRRNTNHLLPPGTPGLAGTIISAGHTTSVNLSCCVFCSPSACRGADSGEERSGSALGQGGALPDHRWRLPGGVQPPGHPPCARPLRKPALPPR